MRRTTTLTALLLGATLLVPTATASAEGETCRGEAATIVGTGQPIVGTDGRDVIVTGASNTTSAGGGDDLICVTSTVFFNSFSTDAGPGNDLVDSSALRASYYLTASLGDGADTFIGGVASERVAAGAAGFIWVDVPSESERDIIDTGDGSDSVVSGGPGLANEDDVRTGNGDDVVMWSGVMGAQSVLDAGADSDLLIARASGQTFEVDLAAQRLSRNGVVEASFSSMERLRVDPEPDLGTVTVVGTEVADQVELHAPAAVRVSLGGGDDDLTLAETLGDSRIDLGTGADRIGVCSTTGSIDLDLTKSSLAVDGSPVASVDGVENANGSAKKATVISNDRANDLYIVGCSATIDGGKGKDTINGSKGRDVAIGGPDRDACRAEVEKSCER